MVAALPIEFREFAEAAMELAVVGERWIQPKSVTPKWNELKAASAFEVVGRLLGNESLPLNLRVAVADSVCESCGVHTDPKVALQSADILAAAWENSIPVSRSQAAEILRVLSYQEVDDSYLKVAGRVTEAWRLHVAKRELETGEEVRSSRTNHWMVGLLAVLNDESAFAEAMNELYEDPSEYSVFGGLASSREGGENCGGGRACETLCGGFGKKNKFRSKNLL